VDSLCIQGDCKTAWPAASGGGAAWEEYSCFANTITQTTTNASIYIAGSATTTGYSYLATTSMAVVNKVVVVDGDHYSKTSAGINAAINALPSTGGKVYLPAGIYDISSTVTVKSYVTLEGESATTTILRLSGNADVVTTERN